MLIPRVPSSSSPGKGLYNPKAFITHAASLDQACAHCPRFPTAASRRSLGRVSVPVWPIILSDRLRIDSLGRPLPHQQANRTRAHPRATSLSLVRRHPVLAAVSRGCPRPQGRFPRVTHPSAAAPERAARLACVKRAASVRSEPGSNSQLHPSITGQKVQLNSTTPPGRQCTVRDPPGCTRQPPPPAHPFQIYLTNLSKERPNQRRSTLPFPGPVSVCCPGVPPRQRRGGVYSQAPGRSSPFFDGSATMRPGQDAAALSALSGPRGP